MKSLIQRLVDGLFPWFHLLYTQGEFLMSKVDEVLAAQAATKASLVKIQADVAGLAALIAANQGEVITQAIVDQANELASTAAAIDAQTPDVPPTT